MDQPKARRTRLKGTATHRPCTDCGETKHRINDFKPRWAGCIAHRTERGRRYAQAGCTDCEKLVNGNIRQPRCIVCDKVRQKRQKPTAATVPTVTVPEPEPEPVLAFAAVVVDPVVIVAEPVIVEAVEPEPVAVAMPEPAQEPAPEAHAVVVQNVEPAPAPVPVKAARPKVASKADLARMFSLLDGETGGD